MSTALVHSKALSTSIQTNRVIGHVAGGKPGPTVVFFAGIHGNEPSGVFAMHRVFDGLCHITGIRDTGPGQQQR